MVGDGSKYRQNVKCKFVVVFGVHIINYVYENLYLLFYILYIEIFNYCYCLLIKTCNLIVFFKGLKVNSFTAMARGHQKIQSQAKAAEKQAKMKKQQGHSANDQKKAAQKALVHVCVLCKVRNNVIYLY